MKTNNSNATRPAHRRRKGGTLISVIAVMLIMGVLGVSVISLTRTSEHSHLSANAGSRAYYLAESGLRYAQQIYCSDDGWLHGRQRTLSLQGGEQVNVVRIADTFWATAIVDAGTAKEARALVPMPLSLCGEDPEADPADDFAIFGDVAIALGDNTIIEGDVAITGDNVALKGVVDGNIFAADVTTTAGSSATVTGSIYSSGLVDIRTGTVTGDIHSANGISLRSAQSSVFGGWLFSNGSIEVGGSAQVLGHIHSCGGNVSLSGTSTIGTASDPIEIRASGNVSLTGSATVYGNVYAGGTVSVAGTIVGNVYAGGAISNSGSITGTALQFSPTHVEAPICPNLSTLDVIELPEPTEFTAGGSNISVPPGSSMTPTNYVLAPGTYGSLSSPNNQGGYTRLFLNAGTTDHGVYYLNSVSFGRDTALYLNLSGTYDIRVFVVGDVAIQRELNMFVSTDGATYLPMTDASIDHLTAARIYWESHGSFQLGSGSNWFGSVYTPSGNLSVGNGSYLIGSYYSGGGHDITASTVVHVPPNFFTED